MQLRWTGEAASDLTRIADYLFDYAPVRADHLAFPIIAQRQPENLAADACHADGVVDLVSSRTVEGDHRWIRGPNLKVHLGTAELTESILGRRQKSHANSAPAG